MADATDSKSVGGNPMRVRLSPRAFACLAALLLGAAASRAQQPIALTLRGAVVTTGTDLPIPYAIVELLPGFPQRLTDDSGRFRFSGVVPGQYRLLVRQIGYMPIDSMISLPVHGDEILLIRLWPVGITLPAVTVTGTLECRSPGAPDPALSPELAIVFDQVVENARRYDLLTDSFPRRLKMERTLAELLLGGRRRLLLTDTVGFRETGWTYQPGHIFTEGPTTGDILVRLPNLADFADSVFIANHCFTLVGRDTLEGDSFVRLDFAPPVTATEADVAGAAYLDARTYLIRYTVVRVTRPRRVSRDLASLAATRRFREVAPWIVVTDFVRALRRPRSSRSATTIEEQRLLELRFEKPLHPTP